jgi:hypothetical protein
VEVIHKKGRISVVVSAATLLKKRCMHVNAVAYIIGLMLWQGNASTKVRFIYIYIIKLCRFAILATWNI